MPFLKTSAHRKQMVANGVQMRDWEYGLLESPCRNPVGFCYGFLCTPCFAYQQRMRINTSVNIPYKPCGGNGVCCCCKDLTTVPGSTGEKCCMCCEFCVCPCYAVIVNRDLITVHYHVSEDYCDQYIVACIGCFILCICAVLSSSGKSREGRRRDRTQGRRTGQNHQNNDALMEMSADLAIIAVLSCYMAQQESTLDVVTGNPTCLGGKFISEHRANFANQQQGIEM